jgi:hypothetical protein
MRPAQGRRERRVGGVEPGGRVGHAVLQRGRRLWREGLRRQRVEAQRVQGLDQPPEEHAMGAPDMRLVEHHHPRVARRADHDLERIAVLGAVHRARRRAGGAFAAEEHRDLGRDLRALRRVAERVQGLPGPVLFQSARPLRGGVARHRRFGGG